MLKNKTALAAFIITIIIATACKPLPIRTSKYVPDETGITKIRKDLPFSYYHADSKIRYDVYNSDSVLFIRFDVSDELTIRKIFSFGLEVYVDTIGKRKKQDGFIYPTPGAVRENTVLSPQTGPVIPDKASINELQKNLSPLLIVIHNNLTENKNLFSKNTPISIKLDLDKEGNLSYQAAIPLNEFGLNNFPADREITIGILTGDMPHPDDENDSEDVNMRNGQQSNPYGGNYNNRMYQPGYTGSPGRNQPMQTNKYTKEMEPVSIWIKTILSEKNDNE